MLKKFLVIASVVLLPGLVFAKPLHVICFELDEKGNYPKKSITEHFKAVVFPSDEVFIDLTFSDGESHFNKLKFLKNDLLKDKEIAGTYGTTTKKDGFYFLIAKEKSRTFIHYVIYGIVGKNATLNLECVDLDSAKIKEVIKDAVNTTK